MAVAIISYSPCPCKGQFSITYSPAPALAEAVGFWYNGGAVLPTPAADGGEGMEYIASFFVSATANVAAYYICKWLDRHSKEQ